MVTGKQFGTVALKWGIEYCMRISSLKLGKLTHHKQYVRPRPNPDIGED